jgi:CheY-like chemotaxis protein
MKRAMRMKDEFLANMSHELRTPLNAILGLSESLLEQTPGPVNEKQHKYLGTINESGRHLLELINDILDLAKIESGQIKLDPGRVNIDTVCETSLRMIKQLAQKKNQTVQVEIEKDIGQVWADERRLKQMMVNLLSNAVKFTPEGGQLGLKVGVNYLEAQLLISIWDHGIGIREEDLKRLFQPFVQLDSSLSRESSGTGLGLALVAEMARLHGGSVSVSSQPGQGSQFTILLPWDPAVKADTLDKLKVTGKVPIFKNNIEDKRTILLVEDTDSVVLMLRDYLELSGYQVEVARDGLEGVSKSIALRPDLILMDVQMPGLDGLDATRRIRKEPGLKSTPIIALTALAMPSDRERCYEAGMNDYFSKPINLRELVKTMERHLSNYGTGTGS